MNERTLRVLAPIVALISLVVWVALPARLLDAGARFWNPVRRALLPPLDRLKRGRGMGYAAYELDADEYAGHVDAPPEEVGRMLADAGYTRMPLSAFKRAPDGERGERASWAERDGVGAGRQTHAMLFEGRDGGTDVYAHREYNALNPWVAYGHYRGHEYDAAEGVERVRRALGEEVVDG